MAMKSKEKKTNSHKQNIECIFIIPKWGMSEEANYSLEAAVCTMTIQSSFHRNRNTFFSSWISRMNYFCEIKTLHLRPPHFFFFFFPKKNSEVLSWCLHWCVVQPKPTSSDIITTKPRMEVQEASFPLPLIKEKDYSKKKKKLTILQSRRSLCVYSWMYE